MEDAQLQLQAAVTKTASFNSTAIDLGAGYSPDLPGRPMTADVQYSAGDFTTGDESYTMRLEDSPDNSTFTKQSADITIPVTVAAPGGFIKIGGFILQRYVRLVATLGGTTPSINYQGYLNPFTVE